MGMTTDNDFCMGPLWWFGVDVNILFSARRGKRIASLPLPHPPPENRHGESYEFGSRDTCWTSDEPNSNKNSSLNFDVFALYISIYIFAHTSCTLAYNTSRHCTHTSHRWVARSKPRSFQNVEGSCFSVRFLGLLFFLLGVWVSSRYPGRLPGRSHLLETRLAVAPRHTTCYGWDEPGMVPGPFLRDGTELWSDDIWLTGTVWGRGWLTLWLCPNQSGRARSVDHPNNADATRLKLLCTKSQWSWVTSVPKNTVEHLSDASAP